MTEHLTDLPATVEALASRDWRRVEAAEKALFAAGDMGRDAVAEGLYDPRPTIRKACARWGDHYGSDPLVPHLLAALDDPNAGVRREAVHSLSCQRCKTAPLTVDLSERLRGIAVEDVSDRVRYQAVWALCANAPDADSLALLHRLRVDDPCPRIRRVAHQLLRQHDPEYRLAADAEARSRRQ